MFNSNIQIYVAMFLCSDIYVIQRQVRNVAFTVKTSTTLVDMQVKGICSSNTLFTVWV